MIRWIRFNYLVVLIVLLQACAVGPDYKRPDARVSCSFKEAQGKKVIGNPKNKEWKIAKPCDAQAKGDWWRVFNDKELNQLESKVVINNQNIKNALANYFQARALVDEARANFYPNLSGIVTVNRQRTVSGSTSFNSNNNGSNSSGTVVSGVSNGVTTHVSTVHTVQFTAGWEPDIWGLVRRQVEASEAGAQASAATLAATTLSAQTSLATYYFQLRGIDQDQRLLNATVVNYRKTLKLTKYQYASGVASRADVVQAQSQLEAAQAQAINNGILRAQYEHAIAMLVGVTPAELCIKPLKYHRLQPPAIPLILPSELLERRPDIAQNERLMQQANANIGVAIAAYFPNIDLLASASVAGTGLAHWFSLPKMAWSYGPQITQLIYDGGLRSAEVRAARAGYDATIATYRQTVLAAFQEVEDNIASLRILNKEYVVQAAAVASAREALKLVINQYRSGTVPYSSVITAQTTAYTAEKTASDINYQRMTSAVALISSLGGGWNASSMLPA